MAALACLPAANAASVASGVVGFEDLVSGSSSPAASSSNAQCPNPRTCRRYTVKPYRWPAVRGVSTMRFSINTLQPWIETPLAETAVLAATRAWSAANPNVRFVYGGITSRIPALGDGHSDIGWVPMDPRLLAIANVKYTGSRIDEADIQFNALQPWSWTPCSQRNNACTNYSGALLARFDVQAIATHELGHAIGIGHMTDDLSRDLSMYAQPLPGERKQATLGLGDVLAIRAAYQCKKCRAHPVYAP